MSHAPPTRRTKAKATTWGGLALAALVAIYSFGRPIVNEQMGWDLPAISGSGTVVVDSAPVASTTLAPIESKPRIHGPLANKIPKASVGEKVTHSKATTLTPAKTTEQDLGATKSQGAPPSSKSRTMSPAESGDQDLVYGILKDLGGERYVSPAGLLFTRGGAEGHRLDHLERHTEDDPRRPGKHGVFDGGMEGALKTIDRAYERAKTGSRTTKEIDQERIIYTVDMGGRIGYIGGQDGNRQKNPMARRVRIVLDKNRFIAACPL